MSTNLIEMTGSELDEAIRRDESKRAEVVQLIESGQYRRNILSAAQRCISSFDEESAGVVGLTLLDEGRYQEAVMAVPYCSLTYVEAIVRHYEENKPTDGSAKCLLNMLEKTEKNSRATMNSSDRAHIRDLVYRLQERLKSLGIRVNPDVVILNR